MLSKNHMYYEDARSSYYERLLYPTNFDNFAEITTASTYDASFSSPVPIKFKTLEFGDDQKTVIRKLGRPRFVFEEGKFSPLVLFYREELLNHQMLVQLHFFEDTFVLATQSVIDTDVKWREIIKIIMVEKYGQPQTPLVSGQNLLFSDAGRNTIFVRESINLNIIYSSGQAKHYTLAEQFTSMKLKKLDEDEEKLKALLKNSF